MPLGIRWAGTMSNMNVRPQYDPGSEAKLLDMIQSHKSHLLAMSGWPRDGRGAPSRPTAVLASESR